MRIALRKPDNLGAIASGLCLVHCLATPFLFVAQASIGGIHAKGPMWWSQLDYLFLILSFWAVFKTTSITTVAFIKPVMWISWGVLTGLILNEKIHVFELPEALTYFFAIVLIGLHLYNRRYSTCSSDTCA